MAFIVTRQIKVKEDRIKDEKVYATLDPNLIERKSWFIAFVLWLFGGFFGLHHFYLHRDRHAFITWATLAGYFGFGWFIDLFKLSSYVKDYNEDVDYIENLIKLMKQTDKPPVSWCRRVGSIIAANVFGYLVQASIPVEYFEDESIFLKITYCLLLPFSIAVGMFRILFKFLKTKKKF